MELATIDVPEEYVGTVIEKLGTRKGEMVNMAPSNGGYTRIEFNIPARGLIGYRNEFLTDTRGNGIINTVFNGYEPYKGEIQSRSQGSLVAFELAKLLVTVFSMLRTEVNFSSVPVQRFTLVWLLVEMLVQAIWK